MSNLIAGQKSFQPLFAQILKAKSLQTALFALLIALMPLGLFANEVECHRAGDACPIGGSWSITFDLVQAMNPSSVISFREIDPGSLPLAGLAFKAEFSSDGAGLTCYLSGPFPVLPPNKAIGVVTIHDGSSHQSYLLSSDDGGIMIIIDEF